MSKIRYILKQIKEIYNAIFDGPSMDFGFSGAEKHIPKHPFKKIEKDSV